LIEERGKEKTASAQVITIFSYEKVSSHSVVSWIRTGRKKNRDTKFNAETTDMRIPKNDDLYTDYIVQYNRNLF
jgi:hypothetical protein